MQQIKSNKNIIYKRNSTFTCLFTMDRRKYYILMTTKKPCSAVSAGHGYNDYTIVKYIL